MLSITLINYNHGHFLNHCLERICKNNIKPNQLIIVDDGSTDNSKNVLNDYKDRYSFIETHYLSKNHGALYAANLARSKVKNNHMYCASADDFIELDFIENIHEAIRISPKAGVIFSQMKMLENNEVIYTAKAELPSFQFINPQCFLDDFLKKKPSTHSHAAATVYNTKAFNKVGGMPSTFTGFRDTLVIRLLGLKYGAVYIDKPLVNFRCNEKSISSSYNKNTQSIKLTINEVHKLMTNEFKEYFPKEYADSWKKDYELLHNI